MWSLLIIGTGCTLGRAPRTKETLPDFHEWCRVTRHPRVFCGLTGCQRDPRDRGVTKSPQIFLCVSIYTVSVFDTDLSQVPRSQKGIREEGIAVGKIRRSLDCFI